MADMNANYQSLAEALAGQAPPNWSQARLEARVGDDVVETRCLFRTNGEERSEFLPAEQQIKVEDTLLDMRRTMRQDGRDPWSRAIFTLTPDGKFKLDVKYDSEPSN